MADRAQQAYAFFLNKGWSPHASAAIVGHLQAESGKSLPTNRIGDNGTSYGLGQFHNERWSGLRNFATKNGAEQSDFATQLGYIDHELRTSEKGVGNRLMGAQNLFDATKIFTGYERPQGWTAANPTGAHNFSGRWANAQDVFKAYSGGDPGPLPTPGMYGVPTGAGMQAGGAGSSLASASPYDLYGLGAFGQPGTPGVGSQPDNNAIQQLNGMAGMMAGKVGENYALANSAYGLGGVGGAPGLLQVPYGAPYGISNSYGVA